MLCVFRILYIYTVFRLQPGLLDQHCDKPFATRMKSQSALRFVRKWKGSFHLNQVTSSNLFIPSIPHSRHPHSPAGGAPSTAFGWLENAKIQGRPMSTKLVDFWSKWGNQMSSAKNLNFSTHFSVQFPFPNRWALWPKAQPSMWPGSPLQQLLGHRI